MSILVINGSPNGENSATMKITAAFLRGIGAPAETITLSGLHIGPCRACYACWVATGGHCVQQDDAIAVLEKIRAAETVIWSMPVYCYGAPAPCKALMDRTLCFNQPEMYLDANGRAHHYGYEDGSKKIVLIASGGLPDTAGNFDGLIFEFRHMFGEKTPAVCCGEGSLFMQTETAPLIAPYLKAAEQAGREYRETGGISPATQAVLDAPILPKAAYIENVNRMFARLKQSRKQ